MESLITRKLLLSFLGTASGTPSALRNCTSTALTVFKQRGILPLEKDQLRKKSRRDEHTHTWLVDCAEGTSRQAQTAELAIEKISKIFITHLHVDHVMGIVPILRARDIASHFELDVPLLSIYGPVGLRHFIRSTLKALSTSLTRQYVVHEFFRLNEEVSAKGEDKHPSERPGRDIHPGPDGLYRAFEVEDDVVVDAAPIAHRIPCLGYVFNVKDRPLISDSTQVDRKSAPLLSLHTDTPTLSKVVILGDTSDPSAIIPLARDADVLVHEATNVVLPKRPAKIYVMTRAKAERSDKMLYRAVGHPLRLYEPEEEEEVRQKAVHNGHSTLMMAGEFARKVRAKHLYLNHLSYRVPTLGQSANKVKGWLRDPKAVPFDHGAASRILDLSMYRHQAEHPYRITSGQPVPTTLTEDFDKVEIDVMALRKEHPLPVSDTPKPDNGE